MTMQHHDPATSDDVPNLPGWDLPVEQLWPDAGALEILRIAQLPPIRRRGDLRGQPGKRDGSGSADVFIFQSSGWCLKTSDRRRFAEREDALGSMRALGASKRLLGPWMPPGTALAVARDPDGGWRLWTISPWLTTLRHTMNDAEVRGDEGALGAALADFAAVAAGALRLASSERIVLDLHPSNFGSDGSTYQYLDDDVAYGPRLPAIGYSLLQRVDEYAAFPVAIERYLHEVEKFLAGLSWLERNDHDLAAAIEQTIPLTPAGRQARSRLVHAASRCG